MRARERDDVERGAGADFGIASGLVGIGPGRGAKAERMLNRFANLPDGVFVWTRGTDGAYRLGRIAGDLRRDESPAAAAVGIHDVRPAEWLGRAFEEDEVPPAVAQTFARGGLNFQRTRDAGAERLTADLWAAERG